MRGERDVSSERTRDDGPAAAPPKTAEGVETLLRRRPGAARGVHLEAPLHGARLVDFPRRWCFSSPARSRADQRGRSRPEEARARAPAARRERPRSPRVPSPSRAPSDRGRTAPRSLRRRSNPRRVRKCDERAGASLFHDPRRGSRGQEDSRRVTRNARGGGRPAPAERTQGSRFSGRRSFGNSRPLLPVLTGRIVSRSIKFTRRPTGALLLRFRPPTHPISSHPMKTLDRGFGYVFNPRAPGRVAPFPPSPPPRGPPRRARPPRSPPHTRSFTRDHARAHRSPLNPSRLVLLPPTPPRASLDEVFPPGRRSPLVRASPPRRFPPPRRPLLLRLLLLARVHDLLDHHPRRPGLGGSSPAPRAREAAAAPPAAPRRRRRRRRRGGAVPARPSPKGCRSALGVAPG